MVHRITKLLEEAVEVMDCPEMGDLAEYIVKRGVLAPPISIGQTVYTVIPADDEILTYEGGKWHGAEVFEWEVQGVAYKGGKWYAIDENGYLQAVGSFFGCYLTRQEAEKAIEGGENDG